MLRRSSLLLVLGSTLLFACGDDSANGGGGQGGAFGGGPDQARYASGTRLKVKVQRVGDVEQFFDVYDSELDTSCYPYPAADGSLRCIPNSLSLSVVYRDAACTDPVAVFRPDCATQTLAKFVTAYDVSSVGCATQVATRTFELRAKVATAPATTYTTGPEGCYELGAVDGELYEVSEMAPSTLAALSVVDAPRGDDLVVPYYRGDDGFSLLGDYPHDVKRDVDCYPGELGGVGGVQACTPIANYAQAGTFSDAACTTPIESPIVTDPEGCKASTMGILVTPDPNDECLGVTHVHEVGATVPEAYLSYDSMTCQPISYTPATYRSLGAQIPDSDFPAVEPTIEGTGVVRLRSYGAAGAPLQRFGQFIDEAGAPCYPYVLSDGTTRCAPSIAFVGPAMYGRFYADAACTQLVAQVGSGPCAAPGSVKYAGVTGTDCEGLEMRELGADVSGPIYFADTTASCSESPKDPLIEYHLVGAAVPSDTFPLMTVETL